MIEATRTTELVTVDGVRLTARTWATGAAPRAAVVLVHGFSASATDPQVVAVAGALHAAELDVVAFDVRGHGGSEGETTMGHLERHDVEAAVAAARERADRIVLVGASMGAISVLRYAAVDPDLAGVVAVSCPAHWRLPRNARGLAATLLTQTSPGRALARRSMRVRIAPRAERGDAPALLVRRIRAPLALLHGRVDPFIAATDAVELYRMAPEPRRLDLVPAMGHAFVPPSVEPIVAAVEWTLGAERRRAAG